MDGSEKKNALIQDTPPQGGPCRPARPGLISPIVDLDKEIVIPQGIYDEKIGWYWDMRAEGICFVVPLKKAERP